MRNPTLHTSSRKFWIANIICCSKIKSYLLHTLFYRRIAYVRNTEVFTRQLNQLSQIKRNIWHWSRIRISHYKKTAVHLLKWNQSVTLKVTDHCSTDVIRSVSQLNLLTNWVRYRSTFVTDQILVSNQLLIFEFLLRKIWSVTKKLRSYWLIFGW